MTATWHLQVHLGIRRKELCFKYRTTWLLAHATPKPKIPSVTQLAWKTKHSVHVYNVIMSVQQ